MMNILLLAATETIPQTTGTGIDIWDMIIKGGWLMIPIFILSLIGIYIICERYFAIRKAGKTDQVFIDRIKNLIYSGAKENALSECNAENTPVARVIYKGIKYSHIPVPDLRSTMESTASVEISILEKGLSTLATVAGMAPMIGFLGTVVGMVQAFYDMSLAGNNINITLLSRGIYTAMITTVAGLIVGIIAYFGYNALVSRINSIANKMEDSCSEIIDTVYETKGKK